MKKGRASEKEKVKVKEKLSFILFLVDLTDNSLFKIIIGTIYMNILYS